MKNSVIAIFASLSIHAAILGAYYFGFQENDHAEKSRASSSVVISLSMFETSLAEPEKSAIKQAESANEPIQPQKELPKPVVKKAQTPAPALRKTPQVVERKSTAATPQTPVEPKPHRVVPALKEVKPESMLTQQLVEPGVVSQQKGLSDIERAGLEDRYKSTVRQAILENREYPRQARRRRQQGVSIVAFRIQQNGQIKRLRLISSSGVELLDEAALQAVKQVRQFATFPDGLDRDYWDFEIPVSFKMF